jgi:hypothetical protein
VLAKVKEEIEERRRIFRDRVIIAKERKGMGLGINLKLQESIMVDRSSAYQANSNCQAREHAISEHYAEVRPHAFH